MRTFVRAPDAPNAAKTFLRRKRPRNAILPLVAAAITIVAFLAAFVGLALATTSPTVATGAVKKIGGNSAVLQATVVPGGQQTTYLFQYGPTAALGTQTAAASAGAGATSKAVAATIVGLIPGTPYYYRIEASNASGVATGAPKSFRTLGNPPPGATTGAAENLTSDSVTMTGVVYPQNQTTTYYFKYGVTTAYGVQTAGVTLAAGTAPVAVTTQLGGLEPGM